MDAERTHPKAANLNRLRAAVLGANDGIVSVAGIIAGVAGATDAKSIILTAGLAGIVAGAISMAAGEYVMVIALIATGIISAVAGGSSKRRATIRVVIGGLLAVAVTYVIGSLFRLS